VGKFQSKLVRDKIPEIIQSKGKHCLYHIADKDEYPIKLKEKLHEEVTEFTQDPCLDEAADVIAVFITLLEEYNLDLIDAVLHAVTKENERGAFVEKIILDVVDE
tara:strand:- start:417 stop:731 length:315 start_codon:yes stop_codon:yes gene_type:complete